MLLALHQLFWQVTPTPPQPTSTGTIGARKRKGERVVFNGQNWATYQSTLPEDKSVAEKIRATNSAIMILLH